MLFIFATIYVQNFRYHDLCYPITIFIIILSPSTTLEGLGKLNHPRSMVDCFNNNTFVGNLSNYQLVMANLNLKLQNTLSLSNPPSQLWQHKSLSTWWIVIQWLQCLDITSWNQLLIHMKKKVMIYLYCGYNNDVSELSA